MESPLLQAQRKVLEALMKKEKVFFFLKDLDFEVGDGMALDFSCRSDGFCSGVRGRT